MSDINIALEMLLDRTKDGKIRWQAGLGHEVIAALGGQLVEVSRVSDRSGYRLKVLDQTGSKLVSIESKSATPDIRANIENLYDAAQKSRIDTGLAALITELEKV